jgi:hypothetical protein
MSMLSFGGWFEMLVVVVGMVASAVVTAVRWGKPLYRLLPFAYGTACAIVLSWYDGKSASGLATFVAAMNIGAGLLLFAIWIERGQRRGP